MNKMTHEIYSPEQSVLLVTNSSGINTVAEKIEEAYSRLEEVLSEEAALRRTLDELFAEEQAQAAEQLKRAHAHAEAIQEKQALMRSRILGGSSIEDKEQMVPLAGRYMAPGGLDLRHVEPIGEVLLSGITTQGMNGIKAESCESHPDSVEEVPLSPRKREGNTSHTLAGSPMERALEIFEISGMPNENHNDSTIPSDSNSKPGLYLTYEERNELLRWFDTSRVKKMTTGAFKRKAPSFLRELVAQRALDSHPTS